MAPRPTHRAETDDEAADRQTASLAGIAVILLLLALGLLLVREMHAKVAEENCLLSGRPDCALPPCKPAF